MSKIKCSGRTAGEKAVGIKVSHFSAKSYPHKQSKDGNGGK